MKLHFWSIQSLARSFNLMNVKLVAITIPPHLKSNSSKAVTFTPAWVKSSDSNRVRKSVTVSFSSCVKAKPGRFED